MLAALTCVATIIIKIPYGIGYFNLGDCIVLLCGWLMGPIYGAAAAGIGSALADMLSGYVSYAAVTFVIKALMACVAYGLARKRRALPKLLLAGAVAEAVMVGGYFVFETFLYGAAAAAVNVPFNAIQGVAGIVAGVALTKIFSRAKIF